jgi:hypothetical protein
LWSEAVLTANYIRNRSPINSEQKAPWELFTGAAPDVNGMRVFGCIAYALVPKQLRHKLEPVSKKGIFVGYEPGSKAYRILLDDTLKVIVSIEVVFQEGSSQGEVGYFPKDEDDDLKDAPKLQLEEIEDDADIKEAKDKAVALEQQQVPAPRYPVRER